MGIKYSDIILTPTTYIKCHIKLNIVEKCFLVAIKLNKFNALFDMLNNPFYSNKTKHELANIFRIMQRYNNAFKHFMHRWRYIRFIRYENNCDLRLNSLSSYNPVQIISIVEDITIYDFCLPDLIKIINNALLYQENLFASPTLPKNPYTNLPFSIHNLYNIYFFIFASSQIMPPLLYLFFLSNFNIGIFYINNEPLLRENSIKSHCNEISTDAKFNDILTMLNTFAKYVPNIIIHVHFPKQTLIDKLGCLLPDYLTYQYSYYPTKKTLSRKKIKQFLITLNNDFPKFGRIIYQSKLTSKHDTITY